MTNALDPEQFDWRAHRTEKPGGNVATNARKLVESNLIGLSLDIGVSQQSWADRSARYRDNESTEYQFGLLSGDSRVNDVNMAWLKMRTPRLAVDPENPDQWIEQRPPQRDYGLARKGFCKRNYLLIPPYGENSPCQYFVHGREIFPTQEDYDAYVANGKRLGDLPQPLIDRFLPLYTPESMEQRLSAFMFVGLTHQERTRYDIQTLGGNPDDFPLMMSGRPQGQLMSNPETHVAFMDEMRRHVELAASAGLTSDNVVGGRGIRDYTGSIIAMIEPNFRERFAKMDAEITKAAESNPNLGGYFHFKDQILAYAEAHGWDWEIIGNLSKAVRAGIPYENKDLDTYLREGAMLRVKFLIESQVRGLHNPYDPEFVKGEEYVAKNIAQAVVTPRIDKALSERTAVLYTNGPDISSIGVPRYDGVTFAGKYDYAIDGFYDSQPFIYLTNHMKRGGDNLIIAHEFGHSDMVRNLGFVRRFDHVLPEMIERDAEKFEAFEQRIKSIPLPADVPLAMHSELQKDWDELAKIARKRGFNVALLDDFPLERRIPLIKNAVLTELELIRRDLLVFMPQLMRSGDEERAHNIEGAYLDHPFARLNEVPAVVSHLTRCHGGDLVSRILPELSDAVNMHFGELQRYEIPEPPQNER